MLPGCALFGNAQWAGSSSSQVRLEGAFQDPPIWDDAAHQKAGRYLLIRLIRACNAVSKTVPLFSNLVLSSTIRR
jgi:hypothetical protein